MAAERNGALRPPGSAALLYTTAMAASEGKVYIPPLKADGSNYGDWEARMTDLLVARELAHTTAASFDHENAENAVVAARARLLICAHVAPGLTAQLRTTQHPGQMLLVIKNRFAAQHAIKSFYPKFTNETWLYQIGMSGGSYIMVGDSGRIYVDFMNVIFQIRSAPTSDLLTVFLRGGLCCSIGEFCVTDFVKWFCCRASWRGFSLYLAAAVACELLHLPPSTAHRQGIKSLLFG